MKCAMHRTETDLDNDTQGDSKAGQDLTSMVELYKEHVMTPLRPQNSISYGSQVSTTSSTLFQSRPVFDQPQYPCMSFDSLPDEAENGKMEAVKSNKPRSMQHLESDKLVEPDLSSLRECDQVRNRATTGDGLLQKTSSNKSRNAPTLVRKFSDETALRSCLKGKIQTNGHCEHTSPQNPVKLASNTALWKSAPPSEQDNLCQHAPIGSETSIEPNPKHVTFNSKLTVRVYKKPTKKSLFDD